MGGLHTALAALRSGLALAVGLSGLLSVAPASAQDKMRRTTGKAYLETIGARGELLYRHDQAAWHGTDAMTSSLPEGFEASTLRGYVVTPHERADSLNIAFHTGDRVVWEARVKGSKVRDARWLDVSREFTMAEAARVRAVQTAIPAIGETCQGYTPMNTAVLPVEDSDELYVYFLTPMRDMNEAVFGRHYRARVSADGRELIRSRQFTNSCLIVPSQAPKGAKAVGIVVSHLRDPLPQETHVFASLQHDEPVYVVIPGSAKGRADGGANLIFRVDGKHTRLVGTRE